MDIISYSLGMGSRKHRTELGISLHFGIRKSNKVMSTGSCENYDPVRFQNLFSVNNQPF